MGTTSTGTIRAGSGESMVTPGKLDDHATTADSIETQSRAASPSSAVVVPETTRSRYLNNLLPAIGYLDLANGLDFPANVWNQVPVPTFAKVLMGVGGSIAFLSIGFAIVDLRRSKNNIQFLRRERAWLKRSSTSDPRLRKLERSWLDVNDRELGWEVIDRLLLDVCMLIAGVLVGAGTLMAIKGEIPAVYRASNLLSGYIGNSFVAFFAVVNVAWSVFMWKRASRNHAALARMDASVRPDIRRQFAKHARRHRIFAMVNGPTAVVSGVGSLISATLWPGYVVLIPGIIGSVFANHFWRFKLGYSRTAFQDWTDIEDLDILARIESIADIRNALKSKAPANTNFCDLIVSCEKTPDRQIVSFLRDHGLYQSFVEQLQSAGVLQNVDWTDPEHALSALPDVDFRRHPKIAAVVNTCIIGIDQSALRYEERFLSELYGCFCHQTQVQSAKSETTADRETKIEPVP